MVSRLTLLSSGSILRSVALGGQTVNERRMMDVSYLRPFLVGGRSMVEVKIGRDVIVQDAPEGTKALLTRDQWQRLDEAVRKAGSPRLPVTHWLVEQGLKLEVDGLKTMVVPEESCPPLNPLHLPVVHKDFSFDGDDTTLAENAARRVGEAVERLLYEGGEGPGWKLSGLLTHPKSAHRTVSRGLVEGIGGLIRELEGMYFFGPYCALAWEIDYPPQAYAADRLTAFSLPDWFWPKDRVVVFQATTDVVRVVVGQRPTAVQWDLSGKSEAPFRIVSVMVPQIRAFHGNVGVVVGEVKS